MNYLIKFLEESTLEPWCLNDECTTCNARQFRSMLAITTSKELDIEVDHLIKVNENAENRTYAPRIKDLEHKDQINIFKKITETLKIISEDDIKRISKLTTYSPFNILFDELRFTMFQSPIENQLREIAKELNEESYCNI